ncbi:hypothetical protein K501DRAFT_185013, partial [Backusella circina FSU 941]
TAALCYLPTRVGGLLEFYHTEIPISHRHLGIGYRLVEESLRWAEESGTLVIPTCSFVKRHLDFVGTHRHTSVIVYTEEEALDRLYGKDQSS